MQLMGGELIRPLIAIIFLFPTLAFAIDDPPPPSPFLRRQMNLLYREAETITNVYDVERPPLIPFHPDMNVQQRTIVYSLNDKIWAVYKSHLFSNVRRNPKMDLELERIWDRYSSRMEAHWSQENDRVNRQQNNLPQPFIIDGGVSRDRLCLQLPGGVLDCL
jgi:hypothetical protein